MKVSHYVHFFIFQLLRYKYLNLLSPTLDSITDSWDLYLIEGGEDAKSFSSLEKLLDRMLADGVDRQCVVIAFGGGVVGDVAGFAAGVIMRGIELIQIPTTLMSQVDSSVGGKNGINTRQGKNLVGSFLQPRIVLNDVSLLSSLPSDEMKSGYGEIVKYGLLCGEEEFKWLENNRLYSPAFGRTISDALKMYAFLLLIERPAPAAPPGRARRGRARSRSAVPRPASFAPGVGHSARRSVRPSRNRGCRE